MAVVDVAIRGLQAPVLGIGGKVLFHVEMHQYLQVVTAGPQRTDHHIGANAAIPRDIAQGIVELHVIGHITRCHPDLCTCGLDEFLRERQFRSINGMRQQHRKA
ncbi:MAG: hypothetical protein RLZZ553_561 [Verrucomicrobiota bacterium]